MKVSQWLTLDVWIVGPYKAMKYVYLAKTFNKYYA